MNEWISEWINEGIHEWMKGWRKNASGESLVFLFVNARNQPTEFEMKKKGKWKIEMKNIIEKKRERKKKYPTTHHWTVVNSIEEYLRILVYDKDPIFILFCLVNK